MGYYMHFGREFLGMHSGVTKLKGLFLCDGALFMSGVQL